MRPLLDNIKLLKPLKTNQNFDLNSVTIESERLSLQPVELSDAESVFQEFNERVTRYMFPTPAKSIEDSITFINDSISKRQAKSDLVLSIRGKVGLEFLGVCGMHARSIASEPELGIWLKEAAHGQAFGREAIAALVDWAQKNLDITGFVYPVDKENIPSRKIPEALGGEIIGEEQCVRPDRPTLNILVYRIPLQDASRPSR